ncbi:MAG TPA: DUF167 family protein [Enhygromyxa sp.]|nr:DUF167 family protein [Enhygromyxa sp.]
MLRVRPDGAIDLDVQAVPRSSRDAIGQPHGERLKLHVKAPPVDGEANAAILKLLAKTLELPRDAIELVAGQTGKRKTVRIRGLALEQLRAKLGLAALLLGLGSLSACENARELPITVILPADTTELERADNASVVMRPSGDSFTFSVDGLDFSLELEGEPTSETQQLELYLADGEQLLGWGSTAPFSTAGPDIGLALFLGRPGALSSWPEVLDAPDPDLLAAEALARGMLLLQSDGDTFLLNHYTLELEAGATLPDADPLAPDDGGLFTANDGAVIRLAYEQVPAIAWRYDPGADSWTELEVDGADAIGLRAGAATLVDPDHTRVYVLGGGQATDAVAIDLVANEGRLAAAPVQELTLDHPRVGATAMWLPSGDNLTADALIIGGDQVGPLALRTATGELLGPEVAWRDLACAIETQTSEALTVLCVGGSLDQQPTADAARFTINSGATAEVSLSESFLPAALADPKIFADSVALYAQGESRWFRIERATMTVDEPDSATPRARGGHLVQLINGATFVVGGVDQDGVALDRWQVFTPAVAP